MVDAKKASEIMNDDPLAGGQEMTTQQVSFGKVGDYIKGTYTAKKLVKTARGDNYIYQLKGQLGEYHEMDENKKPVGDAKDIAVGSYYSVWGGKQAIDDLFARAKFGDIVAIQFTEEQPSKTKGNSPFKVFRCLHFGKDDTYMGEDAESTEVTTG
jgi:hypothetical protein